MSGTMNISRYLLACLSGVVLCCALSCSREESVVSYLEYLQMDPPADEPQTFEVVGHRGYGEETPENTLAALRRSIAEGVRVAEIDVRLTSDDVPVLLHDETLFRTAHDIHRVSQLSLAEVKKLDAGSYKSIEYRNERIPTLAEALQASRGKLKLILHMKLPHSGPAIAAVIRQSTMSPSDIWLMSDELTTLREMHRLLPGACLVHLVYELPKGAVKQDQFVRIQAATGATTTALDLEAPDEEYMAAARRVGLRVLFWTADRPVDSVEVDRFTADGVITNKPLMWEDWAARIRKGAKTVSSTFRLGRPQALVAGDVVRFTSRSLP